MTETIDQFRKEDQEKAAQEIKDRESNLHSALDHELNGEFSKAAIYYRSCANNADYLSELRNRKLQEDEVNVMVEQVGAENVRRHMF